MHLRKVIAAVLIPFAAQSLDQPYEVFENDDAPMRRLAQLKETVRGHAALNALAAAVQAVGDLERVRIVQMLVFVASAPDFGLQSRVANAASELLIEVLGENGRHARTAIGVAGLPLNTPVEIQMICTAV